MSSTTKGTATGSKRRVKTLACPAEFQLRIVKLCLEEGHSRPLLCGQFGISPHSIQRWVRAYRRQGAAGLVPKRPVSRKSRVADEVSRQAVAVKAEHPEYAPPRMAPYNGAIERTQGEFKGYLECWSWKAGSTGSQAILVETAAQKLNHHPRRRLRGKTACRVYFGGPRIRYSRRKRESVYRWVQELAAEISTRTGSQAITPTAWLVDARQWLVTNGLIKIEKSEKVSPLSWQKTGHN